MKEYKINIAALLIEAMNNNLNKMILNTIPGDIEKQQFHKFLIALNKRGVSTQTFIDAIMEAMTEE